MSRLASIALGALAGVLTTLWWPAAELPQVLKAWARLGASEQLVWAALLGVVLAVSAVLILALSRTRRLGFANPLVAAITLAVAAFVILIFVTAAQIQPALDQRISPAQSGETWQFTGSIVSIPEPIGARGGEQAWRFEVAIQSTQAPTSMQRVRLTRYTNSQDDRIASVPRLGEIWRIEARLYAPIGAVNPAAFDYERWLFQRGLQATGTWVSGERIHATTGISRLRSGLYAALEDALPQGDARAVLQALVIGERGAFDDHLWESLRRTGTSHLVAISGLHVGLLAALAYALASILWRRSAYLCTLLAAPRAAALLALLVAALYAALAGFAIPTQRALWMLAVVLLAQFSRYRMQIVDVLAIALLGVVLFDVRAVLAIGFWLSFAAVALIAFFLQPPRMHADVNPPSAGRQATWWRASVAALRIQFGLGIGMIPLLLLWFGQVSWASPWVNLLAVPLIGWIVVPLALLGSVLLLIFPSMGAWMMSLVAQGLDLLLQGLHRVAATDWAMSSPQHWSLQSTLILMLGVVMLGYAFHRRHRHHRLSRVGWGLTGLGMLVVALLLRTPPSLAPNTVLMRLYDLGRGYAVSIQTAERVVLIDAGLRSGPHFDSGRDVLVPALRAQGINRLDRVWLTGERGDHQGGLPGVLEGMSADEIVSSSDCAAERQAWPLASGSGAFGLDFVLESHATDQSGVCVLVLQGHGVRWVLSGAAPALDVAPPASLQRRSDENESIGLIFSGHGKSAEQWPLWMRQIKPEQSFVARGRPRRYEADWAIEPMMTARTGATGLLEIRMERGEDGVVSTRWSGWRERRPQIWRWKSESLQARN